jgi:hypothetical protein
MDEKVGSTNFQGLLRVVAVAMAVMVMVVVALVIAQPLVK